MGRFARKLRRNGKVTHMRQIEISPSEYRHFVWMAVNRIPSQDASEMDVQVEVRKKLKALGYALPLSEQDKKSVADGEIRYADYACDGDQVLVLEDEEWRWLKDRLRKYLPVVSGYASEDFRALLTKVDEAKKRQVEVVPEQASAG